MYTYESRKKVGAGSIFFIVLFIIVFIGIGYLFFIDKGRFWDILPIVCIPSAVITLILIIFYFVKRSTSGYVFLLFFIIFLTGIILSSFFGPFALYHSAQDSFENKKYSEAIINYKTIVVSYPNSRYSDDSLKNLAYSYYLNQDYENTIIYFKKSIENKILNEQDLEVEKIFADSYVKIAEDNFEKQKYEVSGENYLNAVEHLEKIKQQFPDTNDAFIATYKIPEYLFKAATCFNNLKNWEKTEQILNNIITNYNESDSSQKAKELLFNTYISKSGQLKDNKDYEESIAEFLKIFDLDEEIQSSNIYLLNYYKRLIFSDIPSSMIKNSADKLYNAGEYNKALFLYNTILENYPDLEPGLVPFIAGCKIKIVAGSNYEMITPTDPTGKFNSKENSKIIFDNKTPFKLDIYIGGPDYKIIKLEKESKTEIEIKSGTYEIAVEFENTDKAPFYGKITYVAGKKYREEYKIVE
jgi:tetratricopeptide (TPR) repeat protein